MPHLLLLLLLPRRDVHHCKGTSEIFAEDPNVVVLSLHRYGRYD
jgi:acetoin utilization deacetylase AcuC-like enzyme